MTAAAIARGPGYGLNRHCVTVPLDEELKSQVEKRALRCGIKPATYIRYIVADAIARGVIVRETAQVEYEPAPKK